MLIVFSPEISQFKIIPFMSFLRRISPFHLLQYGLDTTPKTFSDPKRVCMSQFVIRNTKNISEDGVASVALGQFKLRIYRNAIDRTNCTMRVLGGQW